ncbi:MAG: aldo/keto reductase, partial [Eubacterium sp.]|nr:aldo/keto reductase [Eubacterium sp.]
MDILKPLAVVGTNSWGSATYGKVLRGESVDIDTIRKCYDRAKEKDLRIFGRAQDCGLGQAQKMIGEFGTYDVIISSKFTPTGAYKAGQVRKSLEKDLQDFGRKYVDIYWLHLPSDI